MGDPFSMPSFLGVNRAYLILLGSPKSFLVKRLFPKISGHGILVCFSLLFCKGWLMNNGNRAEQSPIRSVIIHMGY